VAPGNRSAEPYHGCALDAAFHRALVAAAGNPELARVHGEVSERIHIIRRPDFTQPARIDATCDEHAQILRAVMQRRADQARLLLRSHIEASKVVVRDHAASAARSAKRAGGRWTRTG
jgi:DNA-binding FadR family transcriptional regulator